MTVCPSRRLAFVLVACLAAAGASFIIPSPVIAAKPNSKVFEPGNYVVQFSEGTSSRSAIDTVKGFGGQVTRRWSHVGVGVSANLSATAAAALAKNPRVRFIEDDGVVSTGKPVKGGSGSTPTTDPSLLSRPAYSWGQDRIDQRLLPLDAKIVTAHNGAGVRAYVVDTGVVSEHTEFGDRVAGGFTAVDDGVGTSDCNWHGTHVAGTVAGAGYGVAPGVTVVPVRVLGCDGSGTWSQVIAGLDWIVANHPTGIPGVVNMSLGGGANDVADEVVRRVIASGLTVIVAAGNDSSDACLNSPARVTGAITVAATDANDVRVAWSNWGPCVDVFAPGEGIAAASILGYGASIGSGTSMAAPHVTGAVAIIAAQRTRGTPEYFASNLLGAATTGLVSDSGIGTPNRLMFLPTSAPPESTVTLSAPSGVTATGGKNKVNVAWKSATGADVVTAQLLSGSTVLRTTTVAATSQSLIFSSVPKGTYAVEVFAQTSWGASSSTVSVDGVVVSGR